MRSLVTTLVLAACAVTACGGGGGATRAGACRLVTKGEVETILHTHVTSVHSYTDMAGRRACDFGSHSSLFPVLVLTVDTESPRRSFDLWTSGVGMFEGLLDSFAADRVGGLGDRAYWYQPGSTLAILGNRTFLTVGVGGAPRHLRAAAIALARLALSRLHSHAPPLRGRRVTAPAIRVELTDVGNGKVTISWTPLANGGRPTITGYRVAATPAGNDRVPRPSRDAVTPPSQTVPATASSLTIGGLFEDCHQLYRVTVTPETDTGPQVAARSAVFRPSGHVVPGQRPPYVVVLLDGIGSQQAGFQINPYHPTSAADPPTYCPENIDAAGTVVRNDFLGKDAAKVTGPWEFFSKWNYFDANDDRNGNDPAKQSNSTPRDLTTGRETHAFMLDAIAATGAMILPYSYWGATLKGRADADPKFVFNAYTDCNSSPIPAFCSSQPDAGGRPDPARSDHDNAVHSFSLTEDEDRLMSEVDSIERVWPGEPIVIVGHSQGGLIAFEAWRRHMLPRAVRHIFSIDSPINGACGGSFFGHQVTACVGPPGYPRYDLTQPGRRWDRDRDYLSQDRDAVFRFIGTRGDEVRAKLGPLPVTTPGYGTGDETLQHQLLVTGPCRARDRSACPDPPDHVSDCPVPEGRDVNDANRWIHDDGHFIAKFCAGNVAFFNTALGLSLAPMRPTPPATTVHVFRP